jgi:uncharacterized FlaG/YvyC family protein
MGIDINAIKKMLLEEKTEQETKLTNEFFNNMDTKNLSNEEKMDKYVANFINKRVKDFTEHLKKSLGTINYHIKMKLDINFGKIKENDNNDVIKK